MLAGAPKVGKSWLVLQLCMQIAKGEPFWDMKTQASDVLYLALEDSLQRLQRRLLTFTAEPSPRLHIGLSCSPLSGELKKELTRFVIDHPLTRLIVIDTFQMVRGNVQQVSYANDYAQTSELKKLADSLNICILLVHHTRKMADSDHFNEISGTNGIAGCADTLLVLTKEKRADRKALLSCTGRDIEDLELELELDRLSCRWRCKTPLNDVFSKPKTPPILRGLVEFMKKQKSYEGPNKAFAGMFGSFLGEQVNMAQLSRKMSYFRYELEDMGVSFMMTRNASERGIIIVYKQPEG